MLHTLARLWRQPALRGLLLAHFASNFGDWLAFLALFHRAALDWHTNVLGIGAITISYLLPFVLVAPIAGVVVDRSELRRVLVTSDLTRAGLVLAMLWAPSLLWLCLLVFLHQAVSTFFNPAQQAALPRLVAREDLLAANAMSTQASHATKVLGPGIAGVLVAALGTDGCLLLDAGTFVLSAWLLRRLPRLPSAATDVETHTAQRTGVGTDLVAALRWLRKQPRLGWVVASLALSLCGMGAFLVALPIHARDSLQLGSRGMGLLLSALGAGTVCGAFVLVSQRVRGDRLLWILAAGAVVSVCIFFASQTSRLLWSMSAVLGFGIGTAWLVVPAQAMFQEETPENYRGRILSLALAVLALAQVAGMAAAALWAQTAATPQVLLSASALPALGSLLLGAACVTRRLLAAHEPVNVGGMTPAAIRADDHG